MSWRTAAYFVLAGATLVLLSSVGGAGAYAAPVLLPLQFLAARSSNKTSLRIMWAVLGAATAAEATWVVTYLVFDESTPLIWILPSLGALVTAALIMLESRKPLAPARLG